MNTILIVGRTVEDPAAFLIPTVDAGLFVAGSIEAAIAL